MNYIPTKMEWLSYFGRRRPINGQKIFYYGPNIGVWRGTYSLDWSDPYCPHRMICGERNQETDEVLSEHGLDKMTMMVDRMDAPWWMPDEGQEKPAPPSEPYPKDYPSYEN
jgi:hypothetical protein